MAALVLYADAAAQSRCTEAALILYELLEPWADQLAATASCPTGTCGCTSESWLRQLTGMIWPTSTSSSHVASTRANGYGEIERRAAALVGPEVSAQVYE
jgi:hypothetical protein